MSHVEATEESLDIGMPRWREDAWLERQVADRDWCISQLTGEIIRLKESAEIDAEALRQWFAVEVCKLAVLVAGSHWVDVGRGKLNGSQAADRGAIRHGLPAWSAAFEVAAQARQAARRGRGRPSPSARRPGGRQARSLLRRLVYGGASRPRRPRQRTAHRDPAGTPRRPETQAQAEGAVMSPNPRVLAQIGWFAGRHHSFAPVALHALRIIKLGITRAEEPLSGG
jgi:hypothetical protein